MNMKKTIAAVAACAMAVSAMATTVSAVDENATEAQSLHYDLTIKEEAKVSSLSFVAKDIKFDAKQLAIFYPVNTLKGFDATKSVAAKDFSALNNTITVVATDLSTKQYYTFTFTANTGSKEYDGTTSFYYVNKDGQDVNDATGTVTDRTAVGAVLRVDLENSTQGKGILNAFAGGTTQIDVSVKHDTNALTFDDQGALSASVSTQKIYCQLDDAHTYPEVVDSAAIADPKTAANVMANGKGELVKTDVKKPMKTVSNTKSNTAEIFGRLGTKGTKSKDSNYVNVSAVVNDMIANYDDVVFTFNTATDNVFTKAYLDANENAGNWSTNSIKRLYQDYYVTGVPTADSWMGEDTFKSFPQALYNLFGDEGTGNVYSDSYTFNNLFNAALVANNELTMNQSSITPFVYSKTAVSFSWSDMTGGNAFVHPASALRTLQLATSSDWYWDSMDVTGYTLAADDASTDAGANDDGEDLDDADDAGDDADIDDGADDIDDGAGDVDADDTDDVDTDDTDAADDTTDVADDTVVPENPATGNAPIALAVIPVALAAAAVVAKKRG